MAYHISNLGSASQRVQAFADLDGFVPGSGEDRAKYNYPTGYEWDDSGWAQWCADADAATAEAQAEIDALNATE